MWVCEFESLIKRKTESYGHKKESSETLVSLILGPEPRSNTRDTKCETKKLLREFSIVLSKKIKVNQIHNPIEATHHSRLI